MLLIDEAEERLCEEIRKLGHGDLYPEELVPGPRTFKIAISEAEKALITNCRILGTPRIVKIANGCPLWGEYEVITKAGLANKRIKFA